MTRMQLKVFFILQDVMKFEKKMSSIMGPDQETSIITLSDIL